MYTFSCGRYYFQNKQGSCRAMCQGKNLLSEQPCKIGLGNSFAHIVFFIRSQRDFKYSLESRGAISLYHVKDIVVMEFT